MKSQHLLDKPFHRIWIADKAFLCWESWFEVIARRKRITEIFIKGAKNVLH